MFDPTIYDNLKTVLEGHVYDLDLSNRIQVVNRNDRIDIATMSRSFCIQFRTSKQDYKYPLSEIKLDFSHSDYTQEMFHGNVEGSGCMIQINLYTNIHNIQTECTEIKTYLKELWNNQAIISQEISYSYGNEGDMNNKINLNFQRKINESHINDLESIVTYTVRSMEYLFQRSL
ncbi:hypothetical protein J2S74_005375 [Evansella vedderi]|uniref:Uncharacterized protein n=1 Tax=Evansella vedderi TaxID=38282 RepID=A0ABU0A346_9BACI|nr:hypothetical protein [Evansella vedderi]MDQ0257912.1 hypothetical protein [Evansella vedderi]